MLALTAVYALALTNTHPHSDATLVSSLNVVQPGHPFLAGIHMKMDPEWHCYWKNPGDTGIPTSLKWNLPVGWTAGPIMWPTPHKITMGGLVSYVYEKEATLLVRITAPLSAKPGTRVDLKGSAEWLICERGCLAAKEAVSLTLAIGKTEQPNAEWAQALAKAESRLPRVQPFYTFSATRDQRSVTLDIKPVRSGRPPLRGAVFYPEEELIEAAAPQVRQDINGQVLLKLKVSDFAPANEGRLRGLLVAPPGRTWEDGINAYVVDTPIASKGT